MYLTDVVGVVLGTLDAVEEGGEHLLGSGEAGVCQQEHPDEVLLLKVRAGQLLEQLLQTCSSNLHMHMHTEWLVKGYVLVSNYDEGIDSKINIW